MGLQLDEGTEIRVWDSSAEVRYLVLPEQPSETVGLPEGELTALISRDAMIGVARVEPV
jgi:nitrile hydratase